MTLRLTLLTLFALTSPCLVSNAQEMFEPIRFDFDGPDGSSVPPEWELGVYPQGTREIRENSFVITAPTDFGGASSVFLFEPDDLVVETQIRFLEDRPRLDYATVAVRDDVLDGTGRGYFGSVNSDGQLLLARAIPGQNVDPDLNFTAEGFDAVNQDLKMRLVANGPSIQLFAWPATEPMPNEPQLSLQDDRYLDSGLVQIANSSFQAGSPASPIAFRYIEITPVPEPSVVWLILSALPFGRFLRQRRV